MDATTLSITLSAILAVICIPCGLFLGLVPMKADLVTAKQSKASQMVSFIVAIVSSASPLPRSPHCTPGLCTSGRSSNPRKWLPPPSASRKPGRSKLWPYLFAESGISTSVSRFFIGRTYPLRHIAESYCRNTPQVRADFAKNVHRDPSIATNGKGTLRATASLSEEEWNSGPSPWPPGGPGGQV